MFLRFTEKSFRDFLKCRFERNVDIYPIYFNLTLFANAGPEPFI